MTEIPTIPNQADQDIAQAALDAVGDGWTLSHVIKGNFQATRNEQVLGLTESQASATLDGLVQAVKHREETLSRQEETS